MASQPRFLRDYSIASLQDLLRQHSIEPYRARQILETAFSKSIDSFDQITTLPGGVKSLLERELELESLTLSKKQISSDGTVKFLFDLKNGGSVETVLIPSESVEEDGAPKRRTLCISSQVGCAVGCKFCATASLKFRKSLSVSEIVDQYYAAARQTSEKISNVVFMGMGEPMLNYDNVRQAVQVLSAETYSPLGPNRITVSTAGVIPGIIKYADDKVQAKLAISLHATTNTVRSKIIPIAAKYTLSMLMDAVEYYYRKVRKPVTYEYILFEGLNDSDHDIARLARITRRVKSKVNIIPFHEIEFTNPQGISANLKPAPKQRFNEFVSGLRNAGVTVMVRSSSGLDIDAACGQLAFSEAGGV